MKGYLKFADRKYNLVSFITETHNHMAEDKQIADATDLNLRSKILKKEELVQSEHVYRYQEAFKAVNKRCQQMHPNFSKHNITYTKGSNLTFSYRIMNQLNSFEIVKLKVEMGDFILTISILNSNRNSPLTKEKELSEGAYGKLYTFSFLGQNIAAKSYKAAHIKDEKFQIAMSRTIQEYSIAKICDCLGCGPAMKTCFGFDLLVFNNRIEFAMELCQNIELNPERYSQLLESLSVMHQYKIIHMDIKTQNIMFSWAHQKVVYIDYGFSKVIAEDCGFKSQTQFRGTVQFVSKEMLDLFTSNYTSGKVDLYFNDLICLQSVYRYHRQNKRFSAGQKFFEFNLQKQTSQEKETNQDEKETFVDEYHLILLKHEAYFNRKNVRNILNMNQRVMIKKYGKKLLKLFVQLLPSTFYEDLILTQLSELSNIGEYQQFIQQFKLKKESMALLEGSITDKNNREYCIRLIRPTFQENEIENNPEKMKAIYEFAQNPPQFQSEEDRNNYFSFIFDCLKFDRFFFSISAKRLVAESFLRFIKVSFSDLQDYLASIKATYKYFLTFCLSEPLNEWKKSYRFNIMVQSFLMQLDFSKELSKYSNYNLYSLPDLLQIYYQYTFVIKLDRLIIKVSIPCRETLKQIRKSMQEVKKEVLKRCQKTTNKQEKKINEIMMCLLKIQSQQQSCCISEALHQIDDDQTIVPLVKVLLFAEHEYYEKQNDFSAELKTLAKIHKLFQQSPQFQSRMFFQKVIWQYFLLDIIASTRQGFIFREDIRQAINCDKIYQRLVFYLDDQLESKTIDQGIIRKLFLQLVEIIFQQEKINCLKDSFYALFDYIKANRHFAEQNTDIIQIVAEQSLNYLRRKLASSSIEKKQKSQQAELSQNCHSSVPFKQHICQFIFVVYENLLILGKSFESYLRQFQYIIKFHFWQNLQKQAANNQMLQDVAKYTSVFYFLINKTQSTSSGNLKQSMKLSFQFLQQSSKQCDNYFIAGVVNHILKYKAIFCKDVKQSNHLSYYQEKSQKILIWGWRYCNFYKKVRSYLDQVMYSVVIYQTFQVLWNHRQQCKDAIYEFVKSLIQLIGQNPYYRQSCYFIVNIEKFFEVSPNFFKYSTLVSKLGRISWQSRYQLNFTIYCLLVSTQQQKRSLIKDVLNFVDTLAIVSKQRVLYMYFDYLQASGLIFSWKKRRLVYLLKYLMTKIRVGVKNYHGQVLKNFVKYVGLSNRQHNFFQQRLKQKIMKCKY